MDIDQIINQIYRIPENSKALLKERIIEIDHCKDHILLKAERVESDIYFIKKGIVRAYALGDDSEITFWFGEEGEAILSMQSYVENQKAYENIVLLENCELYKLSIAHLRKLFNVDINIANWGRKLAEKELLKIEKRLISRELHSAKQRYDELIKNTPSLLQRVPLKFLASYLGITPVSLSRIRKEK